MSTKTQILALLEGDRGQSISGEYIAERLNISRSAVWKSIKELEKAGYKIKAVTNKGYCLCEDNDIISIQGILPYLSNKDFSEKIFVYDSLESTNKNAKEMAISGAEHGSVIIADNQTAGRGRYDRKFFSPPGHGIYMSLIIHPSRMWFETPTLLTIFAAVSVCEAIESITDKKPQVKWVNDIFLERKKICGILTEAVLDLESGNIQWIVIGIGLNFSTPSTNFPEELQKIAGSVFADENPTTTRNQLIAEIVNRMILPEKRCSEKRIIEKYRQRLMMIGKKVTVSGLGEPYEAIALDIDELGGLVVKKDSGEITSLSAGEISVRENSR